MEQRQETSGGKHYSSLEKNNISVRWGRGSLFVHISKNEYHRTKTLRHVLWRKASTDKHVLEIQLIDGSQSFIHNSKIQIAQKAKHVL